MALRVFYGYTKINKIMKKRSLMIAFENENRGERNETSVKSWMQIVYTRNQSEREMQGAKGIIRMFTVWYIFIDKPPYNGDIYKVLEENFQADSKNVSEEERIKIREALKMAFGPIYEPISKNYNPVTIGRLKSEMAAFDSCYARYCRLSKPDRYMLVLTIHNAEDYQKENMLNYLRTLYSVHEKTGDTYNIMNPKPQQLQHDL